ncbi:MAG: hypothetical protein DDT37_01999 [Firmicutes bacterium]|nr:hypothetical protein [candidate division NPL-UPA2 bacterium]
MGGSPLPLTVTTVPTPPLVGDMVSAAAGMMNGAVAVVARVVLVAVTAVVAATTAKVAVNVPSAAAVVLIGVTPIGVTVMVSPGTNPLPLTVTVVPTGPRDGVRVRLLALTVNVAVASATTTSFPPGVVAGTRNLSVVALTTVGTIFGSPANVIVAGTARTGGMAAGMGTTKPIPVTVTKVPTGPLVGAMVTAGVSAKSTPSPIILPAPSIAVIRPTVPVPAVKVAMNSPAGFTTEVAITVIAPASVLRTSTESPGV